MLLNGLLEDFSGRNSLIKEKIIVIAKYGNEISDKN